MASELRLALPRFVALKGDNDRIKQTSSGKFWRLGDSNFILADAGDSSNDNTLFHPFKVDSQSIALLSSANNLFCTRYSLDPPYLNALNANADFTNFWAGLRVEEPVMKREISNIVYHLEKSNIRDKKSVVLVTFTYSATNTSRGASTTVDVKLPYQDVKTTIWKTKLSLELEAKATFETTTFPVIVDGGKVGFSGEARRKNELDETIITTTLLEDVHSVVVPPKTKVVVSLIATKGKCDIPFTFTQSDTLYNGKSFTTEVKDNTYTVCNLYDFKFQTTSEPVDA
ncbi:hypothetical protein V6N11_055513 [Hibiscus sabdariffa]|uniref:Uncharacterized protein n=2 Tax=Hibiscus sabdariffa TaxID=183260 RepID=A0ABR2NQR9_9ROSI